MTETTEATDVIAEASSILGWWLGHNLNLSVTTGDTDRMAANVVRNISGDIRRQADEQWDDLKGRLEAAAQTLDAMAVRSAETGVSEDHRRLAGKVEGVKLALSYMAEYTREPEAVEVERLRDAILALHRPDGGVGGPGAMCVECTVGFGTPDEDPRAWPCPTARMLGASETP